MILYDIEALLRSDEAPLRTDGGSSMPAVPATPEPPKAFSPCAAVSTVFEQARPLQEQLGRIPNLLEPIGCLSQLAKVFAPLGDFKQQIEVLATMLEPMRSFQDGLREVMQQYTPLKALDRELDQLSQMLCESLGQVAQSLDDAVAMHERLLALAAEFEPARSLRHAFAALAQSFGASSEPDSQEMSHGEHVAQ